jgi:hypothetical protein
LKLLLAENSMPPLDVNLKLHSEGNLKPLLAENSTTTPAESLKMMLDGNYMVEK